ncbi:S8 family serine peptidase [Actinomadura sp. 9N215]|uniref:S8 family serine peptidase n=1 Tax=Actinomadura sp. 9N215 TaxID=3375150 RepID=UPI00378E8C4E
MKHPPSGRTRVIATLTTIVLLGSALAAAPASADAPAPKTRVVIELAGPAALKGAGGPRALAPSALAQERDRVRDGQRAALAAAESAGVRVDVRRTLTDQVNAIAATVPAADVGRLARLPGVRAVRPDRRMRMSTDVSVPLVGAPQVWKRDDPKGRPTRGTGVTVAVIDTGIDYTNPSLGGGFGPGHRVVAGLDIVNGDGDPADDNGHGTHVAGIVAGSGAVTGVAPDATLTAYKVLDDWGSGYESDIATGLQAAVDPANPHRADVVNLRLGGTGDGTDLVGRAATAAAEAGVVVVASAGNSGPAAETVGTPAAADGVLAVGASTSGLRLPAASLVEPVKDKLQSFRVPFSANPPAEPATGELVDVGEGAPADFDRAGDVRGKIVAMKVLLPTSPKDVQPWMLEAARLAEERGAIGLLAYTTSGGGPVIAQRPDAGDVEVPVRTLQSGDSFRMDKIVVLGVDPLQWREVAAHLAKGKVRIRLQGEDMTDRLASFSSRGPTSRYTLKPEIVAPGVEIRSTWPVGQWKPGVYRLSGTSMASPHVAGAAALVRQAHPGASSAWVRAALTGSAKGLAGSGPRDQGAGRLDVDAATRATVTASPSAVSMGLADLGAAKVSGSGTVTLQNSGSGPVGVKLRVEKAPGSPGDVRLSAAQATIPAGGKATVSVAVSADRPGGDAELSGWIVADADEAPDVRVPYLLSVRPLVVQTSPDPSDGTGEVFVYGPADLAAPPVVTVTPPHGRPTTVRTKPDHGRWYRASLTGRKAGVYRLAATASATAGQRLVGAATWEVTADDSRPGRQRWTPVGPNGEAGDIATTPRDPAVAALDQPGKSGPWVTEDHGATWAQRTRLPVAGGTGKMIIDARWPKRMWYAINGEGQDPTYQGRILRSDDAGRTWRTLPAPDTAYSGFVADARTRALIAVTADGLVVSRDRGDSWTRYPLGLGDEVISTAVGGDDLYVATRRGVWAVRGLVRGEPSRVQQVFEGDTDKMVADGGLIAVLGGDDRVRGSRDGGATWQDLIGKEVGGAIDMAMRDGNILVSTYYPDNMISRDHGRTWAAQPGPVTGAIETDIAPWGRGSLLLTSARAGMFRTGDRPGRVGVQGVTVYDMAVTRDASGRTMLVAGTDYDTYRTPLPAGRVRPETSEWGLSGKEAHHGSAVAQVTASPSRPGTVWKIRKSSAISSFFVLRSTDGGATWEQRGVDSEIPLDLVVGPAESDRVVVPFWSLQGQGLYVTRDAGAHWKKLFHDQLFTTAAADPADPDRLWLGGADGLYRSDDYGTTVTKVLSGPVTAITVDGRRIIAGGDTIRRSDDGGRTFRDADAGGLPMSVSALATSPKAPDTVYAATATFAANGLRKGGRGVLRSRDGGRTWENVSGGLQNLSARSLTISPDGRWLFAGTDDAGVHRLQIR